MNTMDAYQIKVRGRLSTAGEGIKQIQATLETASHWIPGHGLQSECREAIHLLEKMEERLVHKLWVTLGGPSGAGKSTLLNALAGDDQLSRIGINRPTTREVVVYCRSLNDAELLLKDLGPDRRAGLRVERRKSQATGYPGFFETLHGSFPRPLPVCGLEPLRPFA